LAAVATAQENVHAYAGSHAPPTTARMAQGKTMAEHQETQQEKETRWTAQRAAHDKQQSEYRAARVRKVGKNWVIVGAIVIIVAVIAAAVFL
jgi:hypothetical protein